jgi:hypothetical protein
MPELIEKFLSDVDEKFYTRFEVIKELGMEKYKSEIYRIFNNEYRPSSIFVILDYYKRMLDSEKYVFDVDNLPTAKMFVDFYAEIRKK